MRFTAAGEVRLLVVAATASVMVLLWGIPALAAAGVTSDDIPLWGQILIAIAAPLGTIVLGLLGKVLAQLGEYVAQRSKMAWVAQVDDFIMNVISELWRTEVKALKAAAVDGKLTSSEKSAMKRAAMDSVYKQFGAVKLLKVIGGSDAVSARIETSLMTLKKWGPQNP